MQDLFCGAPLLSRSYAFSFVRALGPASVIYDRIFGRSEPFCSDGEEFSPKLSNQASRSKLHSPSIPNMADSLERLIMTTLTPFAHRRNPDASFDSICTKCFQTISSEESEGKLIAHEERHTCDPVYEVSRVNARSSVNGLG
jgi:hypothetical protein